MTPVNLYENDTREYLGDSPSSCGSTLGDFHHVNTCIKAEDHTDIIENMHVESELSNIRYPDMERRKKLPDPIEKEKAVSLWSMIKDNVGKDLTQVCLPDPVGVLTLEFDDGEIFQWSKVTTAIHNLILGKIYCDHHGTMDIRGNKQHSCILKFKEQSILYRNPHQVQGFVEDDMREKVATLFGKWDDRMYYVIGDGGVRQRYSSSTPNTELLWKRNKPSVNLTRYNLTSFAISLNELTPGLQEKLPPTDSRLRPDQRHLENGEYEKANAEKLRSEMRQRMSRKLQENGWKPRWFEKDADNGAFRYVGGYWEAREQRKWDTCPKIFSELVVGDSCETL
ncbi:hypothetical protein ACHQM5_029740 [Ranunculus cassubicifolius]